MKTLMKACPQHESYCAGDTGCVLSHGGLWCPRDHQRKVRDLFNILAAGAVDRESIYIYIYICKARHMAIEVRGLIN